MCIIFLKVAPPHAIHATNYQIKSETIADPLWFHCGSQDLIVFPTRVKPWFQHSNAWSLAGFPAEPRKSRAPNPSPDGGLIELRFKEGTAEMIPPATSSNHVCHVSHSSQSFHSFAIVQCNVVSQVVNRYDGIFPGSIVSHHWFPFPRYGMGFPQNFPRMFPSYE